MTTQEQYFQYEDMFQMKYKYMCILMQIGAFYEIYGKEDGGNICGAIVDVARILDIEITKRSNKAPYNIRSNAHMAGFPLNIASEKIAILIENNYTVIVIDQVDGNTSSGKVNREITKILSPGTFIESVQTLTNNILSIHIEKCKDLHGYDAYTAGNSVIDLSTGKCSTYEIYSKFGDYQAMMEELYRFIESNNPKEIIVSSNYEVDFSNIDRIIHIKPIHYDYTKASYQNQFLAKIYPNTGMMLPVEYMELNRNSITIASFINLLQFAYEHNPRIVNRIQKPSIWTSGDHLILYNNALYQLDVVGTKGCLFDILNKTRTVMGKRRLNERLLNPILSITELNTRYDMIEKLQSKVGKYSKLMTGITDLERMNRHLALGMILPKSLVKAYNTMIKSYGVLNATSDEWDDYKLHIDDVTQFGELITQLDNTFYMDSMLGATFGKLNQNIFKRGVCVYLDETQDSIQRIHDTVDMRYNEICNIAKRNMGTNKVSGISHGYNERDGFYISVTNSKYKYIKDELTSYTLRKLSGKMRLYSDELKQLSHDLGYLKHQLEENTRNYYYIILEQISNTYHDTIQQIAKYIGELDMYVSCARVANEYGYNRPKLIDTEQSSVHVTDMRHPIIERLIDSVYIPNDLKLDGEGMLLFGLNAVGKSSLMKALGVNVLMAQAGMFVSCSSMTLSPYTHLFTRITADDDMINGKSTFAVEMGELRSILRYADNKSLVLGDEICKGTEHISALSIVYAALERFSERNVTYIFATHLHDIIDIIQFDNIKVSHLSVDITDKIVYNRILTDGCGSSLYGIEVAEYMLHDDKFINQAHKTRNKLLGVSDNILDIKPSRYNSSVYVDKCEICDNTANDEQLDVHHIIFQSECDENGRSDHVIKNMKGNLVVLCKTHHNQVHMGSIVVNGWKVTSEGMELDYIEID